MKHYSVVVVIDWRILHHVVLALTMTKITNILSKKNRNDALLFDTYTIKHDIDNTIEKELF